MRTCTRGLVCSAVLLSAAAGPWIKPLAAGSVSYSYSGTVYEVSQAAMNATGVAVGDTITGTFIYDATQHGTNGVYTYTGSGLVHNFTLKVFNPSGALQFSDQFAGGSSFFAVKLFYGAPANGGTIAEIQGDTTYKQGLGVTGPGPPPAFYLGLANPNNAGGYTANNLPLPTSALIQNFVKTTGLLNWDPMGQQFSAHITSFVAVPEPSTLVMTSLMMVMGCAGVVISRRKQRSDTLGGRSAQPASQPQ